MQVIVLAAAIMTIVTLAACSSATEVAGSPERLSDSTADSANPPPRTNSGYVDVPLRLDGTFSVVTLNGKRVIRTTMVATNTGATEFGGQSGAYPWRLLVFADSARKEVVWRLDDYLNRSPDLGRQFLIQGGTSRAFDAVWFPHVPVDSILGDNAPGHYFASMELVLDEPPLRSKSIPAGEIVLTRP